MAQQPGEPRRDLDGRNLEPLFAYFEEPNPNRIYPSWDEHGALEGFTNQQIEAILSGQTPSEHILEPNEPWTKDYDRYVYDAFHFACEKIGIYPNLDDEMHDWLFGTIADSEVAVAPWMMSHYNTPHKVLRMQVLDLHDLSARSGKETIDRLDVELVIGAALQVRGINIKDSESTIYHLVTLGPEIWHDQIFIDAVWFGHHTDVEPTGHGDKTIKLFNPILSVTDTTGQRKEVQGQAFGTLELTVGQRTDHKLPRNKRAYLDHKHHALKSADSPKNVVQGQKDTPGEHVGPYGPHDAYSRTNWGGDGPPF